LYQEQIENKSTVTENVEKELSQIGLCGIPGNTAKGDKTTSQ
jgi:hypothetical protein